MKTGIGTSAYTEKGFTDFKQMRADGFDCADEQMLCDTNGEVYGCGEERFYEILKKRLDDAKSSGIVFSQVHGPWPVCDTTPEKRAQNLSYMKTAVRAAKLLECKNLVVHPVMPYKWAAESEPEYAVRINREYFTVLCEYALEYGVNICIENMPTKSHSLADVPSLIKFTDEINLPNFKICFDTGHANVTGQSCAEMVKLLGKRMTVMHVHDNKGYYDTHTAPFDGTIDWESFKNALADTGFDGCVSIESGDYICKCPPALKSTYRKALHQCAAYFAGKEI